MAAIRMLFSWLTEKGLLAMNPAREVDKAELSVAFLFPADTSRSDSDLLTQPSVRSFIR
jgi:hypothetical protein